MEKQKVLILCLIAVLIIGMVAVGGCIQEEKPEAGSSPPEASSDKPQASSEEQETTEDRLDKTLIEDNMRIGAFYYPWYDKNRHWSEGYKGNSILDEYSSRDQATISKHIDWASDYGIDFFLMSWWGPNSWEDRSIRDYFLKSKDITNIKFAILYETYGRLTANENGKISFDNPDNKLQLIDDFKYFSKTYFNHEQYLKINNKPVVFIYLTRGFDGDYKSAITELRAELQKEGYELYLIGDQVYWQSPYEESEKGLMKQFDAITAYNMHSSVPDIDINFVEKVSKKYEEWFEAADSLGVDFIPNVMPGFDDTAVRPEAKHPVIIRDLNQFRYFCEEARKYLSDKNMILITSWNEWHEYTQIEPDQNYSEQYLEVIKQTLANYR